MTKMQIAKWGNSLALRIPAEYLRRLDLKEGDYVETCMTIDGGISIRPRAWDRQAFALELAESREAMPVGVSVIDEVRRGARY